MPACSVVEFAELAAWLAANGGALPTVNGWKKDLDLGGSATCRSWPSRASTRGWKKDFDLGGGATATLSDLTWRVRRGPTAEGSGKVAETIRRLKSRHEGGAAGKADHAGGERPQAVPGWHPSVVRDDSDPGGGPAVVRPEGQ